MAITILVAEDEADIRNLLAISLEESDYTVLTAKDGQEAWHILQSQTVDLAILDVMMPLLDGFNLLRKIREYSTIPVIFLTARIDEMDKVLGLGLGADDYLVKPFSMAELLARVGAQLRRNQQYLNPRETSPVFLHYGELTIDTNACCAFKAGELIELGAKEYKLLLFFMEHPEKIFTKRQLYTAAWDGEFYDDDNTIMVHMSRLRNKIEDNPQKPRYLRTIRGIGYKLHDTGSEL